jgi:hypothetical protein
MAGQSYQFLYISYQQNQTSLPIDVLLLLYCVPFLLAMGAFSKQFNPKRQAHKMNIFS